jgi:HK97 family phage portal protein
MMAGGIPFLEDLEGNRVDNHPWIFELLNNPNPTQSWSDVIFSLSVNDALYSNSFAYAPKRSFGVVNLLVPLPSNQISIQLSGRRLKQMDTEGLIDYYTFYYDDENKERLELDEVIYLTTPDGINIVNPNSRMEALKYPLSNIRAAYTKRNVLLENIGAIGILSAKSNDIGGAIPMTPEEKREIQQDWYRRSKDELIITEADVNWQPMSYPTKDLMLFEELDADKLALVDIFGLNAYVFSQDKGATFSNVKEGLKMAYTDTIIPETKQMYDALSEQLGLIAEGYKLCVDFSHIPVMQVDENQSAMALDTRAAALLKIQQSGVVLTEDEQRAILGM